MRDVRNPEDVGNAIIALHKQNPDKTMSQCADMLETIQSLVSATSMPQINNVYANGNGSGNDTNHHPDN